MDYITENIYVIHWKDGTKFESKGSSGNIKKNLVSDELKWISFHIEKEIIMQGKSLDDVAAVEYNLVYHDKNEIN